KTNCFGKYSSDPNVCSGNGVCTSNDVCKCNFGYYGPECKYQCPVPMITSSRYNLDATKIIISFNIQMDTQRDLISCNHIFHNSEILGPNATCEYSSPTELTITLDNMKPEVGDSSLILRESSLKD